MHLQYETQMDTVSNVPLITQCSIQWMDPHRLCAVCYLLQLRSQSSVSSAIICIFSTKVEKS